MNVFICEEPRGDLDPCDPMGISDCWPTPEPSSSEEEVFLDEAPEEPELIIIVEEAAG